MLPGLMLNFVNFVPGLFADLAGRGLMLNFFSHPLNSSFEKRQPDGKNISEQAAALRYAKTSIPHLHEVHISQHGAVQGHPEMPDLQETRQ